MVLRLAANATGGQGSATLRVPQRCTLWQIVATVALNSLADDDAWHVQFGSGGAAVIDTGSVAVLSGNTFAGMQGWNNHDAVGFALSSESLIIPCALKLEANQDVWMAVQCTAGTIYALAWCHFV